MTNLETYRVFGNVMVRIDNLEALTYNKVRTQYEETNDVDGITSSEMSTYIKVTDLILDTVITLPNRIKYSGGFDINNRILEKK